MEGNMRVFSLSVSVLAAVLLAGCGPQDRAPEFYTQTENAAEFAKALDVCKKSGLSQKEKCAAVWQAKVQMDKAEDRALLERAISQTEGATIVPQSPKQVTGSEPVSARDPSKGETAEVNTGNST
jgi:hypothetical protein